MKGINESPLSQWLGRCNEEIVKLKNLISVLSHLSLELRTAAAREMSTVVLLLRTSVVK